MTPPTVDYTEKLAKALHLSIGMVNIQYVLHNDEVYVIEVNPDPSRTVPYISKVTAYHGPGGYNGS